MNRMKPNWLKSSNVMSNPARRAVLCAAALGLLAPLAAGTAQAAPVPAPAPAYYSPVGAWKATVTREGAVYDVQMSFGLDRTVCLVSPAGGSKGTWGKQGQQTFDYHIREMWYDAGGAVEGWVDIDQGGTMHNASTFSSSGVSTVYRPDGTVDSKVPVKITAVRTGSVDPAACA